jgi:hypothetical protein
MPAHTGLPSYYVVVLVVVVVMALRMRRMSRERPLKLERLWIAPVLVLAATVAVIAQAPPSGLDWLWLALAIVLGGGLGWLRGKTMHIEVDPVTHAVTAKGSQAAMAFIVILVAIRFGLRSYIAANASTLHLSIAMAGDLFIAFALGLVCLQRVEMGLRAQRLLALARAAGSTAVIAEGKD